MDAIFFESPAELHKWLAENHDKASELLVGFYKKNANKKGITYAEMLDDALSFGWIDGVRKTIDETRWTIRLTPRKPGSNWSKVNIKRANELIELGRMQPPGLEAFNARDQKKTDLYSYERDHAQLAGEYEVRFRANEKAWEFFQAQPPTYRKAAAWWVISAKQEATRLKRLATLIEVSEHGRRLAAVTYKPERNRG